MTSDPGPQTTLPTRQVLQAMLAEPTREMHGLQISRAAELPNGTIHPILAHLEACGWLNSRWEDIDSAKEDRPRRRYYRLSPDGVVHAHTVLNRAYTPQANVSQLWPGHAAG